MTARPPRPPARRRLGAVAACRNAWLYHFPIGVSRCSRSALVRPFRRSAYSIRHLDAFAGSGFAALESTRASTATARSRPSDPPPARARRGWLRARTKPSLRRNRQRRDAQRGAGRFTPELVTDLAARLGVLIALLLLHAGVLSLEGDEPPYPERYRVTWCVNRSRHQRRSPARRKAIAAGTTVARLLATVTDDRGVVHPGHGWTDVVVTGATPVSSVDGLLTGWHEPEATHLLMLEAVAGRRPLELALSRGPGGALPLARVRRRPPPGARPDATMSTVTQLAPSTSPATASRCAHGERGPAGRGVTAIRRQRRGDRRRHRRRARHDAQRRPTTPRAARRRGSRRIRADGVATAASGSRPTAPGVAHHARCRPALPQGLRRAHQRAPRLPRRRRRRAPRRPLREASRATHHRRACSPRDQAQPRRRVAELTWILDEDGYLATSEKVVPGVYRIVEHNCAKRWTSSRDQPPLRMVSMCSPANTSAYCGCRAVPAEIRIGRRWFPGFLRAWR